MTTTDNNTKVYKGFHGWKAQTIENANGYDWKITTMKTSCGNITTHAQAGKTDKEGCFTFSMFTSPNIQLYKEGGRATEKSVKEQHIKALLKFDELKEGGELPVSKTGSHKEGYEIKIGQVIFLNGYGQNQYHHEKKVIYDISKSSFVTTYKYVNLETLELGVASHIRNVKDLFGIGVYYKEGDFYEDLDELNNILIEAKAKERKEEQRNEAERMLREQATNGKIEEGKTLINPPKDLKYVIVAEFRQDESDSMTDYFAASTTKTIYLAYSSHKRNLFSEMRKACLNCDIEVIKAMADAPKDWEQKQNYTGGSGYFLGESSYRGVNIRKIYISSLDELFIAASENRFYCESDKEVSKQVQSNGIDLTLVDYSEKAIALFGDTKSIKEALKKLGGRFNPRLTFNDEKKPGWIFPKSKTEEVKEALNIK
ncbi:hypothetical protein [Galbibacter sp. BG1]